MKNSTESTRNYIVAKSNDLITHTRYSLTMQQQKILLYLVSKIKPTDSENTMYEVSVGEFMRICGLDNSGFYYKTIQKDIKSMSDVSCWIEVEPGKEMLFRWLNEVVIDRNKKMIHYSFHPSVAPYLFDLRKSYTRYKLKHVLSLKHSYSIRIYEMLKAKMYVSDEFEITVDEMKKRIDAEKYDRFNSFNERVLIPAMDEINALTDLDVEYRINKQGKKIHSITFTVHIKSREMQLLTNMRQAERLNKDSRKQKQEEDESETPPPKENFEQISFADI